MIGDTMYRYDASRTTAGTRIHCTEYEVVGETDKFIKISMLILGNKTSYTRKMLKNARKRFARPTRREALQDFIFRKKHEMKFIEARMRHVNAATAIAEGQLARMESDEKQ